MHQSTFVTPHFTFVFLLVQTRLSRSQAYHGHSLLFSNPSCSSRLFKKVKFRAWFRTPRSCSRWRLVHFLCWCSCMASHSWGQRTGWSPCSSRSSSLSSSAGFGSAICSLPGSGFLTWAMFRSSSSALLAPAACSVSVPIPPASTSPSLFSRKSRSFNLNSGWPIAVQSGFWFRLFRWVFVGRSTRWHLALTCTPALTSGPEQLVWFQPARCWTGCCWSRCLASVRCFSS